MMMLEKIISKIKESSSIAILPHVSADGDAIGSSTALGLAVEKLGKDVEVYLEEKVPYTFSFLPGGHLIKVYDGSAGEYDLAIALDTGDRDRLGKRVGIFDAAKATVNIDHHQTNTMFAESNYVEAGAAAVSEIIYQLVKMSGINLDKDMSTCLYVALVTDTGGFKYSNTTCTTHRIAGELINHGAEVAYISEQIFDNTSLEKVRLMGKAIESMEILEDGKVSVITVTDEMMRDCGAGEEDCEGIVNIGRNVRGVEVGVMLRYKQEGMVKVNLRSRSYVNVSAVAERFSGGGHKRAAGCTVSGSLLEIKAEILNEIRKALD